MARNPRAAARPRLPRLPRGLRGLSRIGWARGRPDAGRRPADASSRHAGRPAERPRTPPAEAPAGRPGPALTKRPVAAHRRVEPGPAPTGQRRPVAGPADTARPARRGPARPAAAGRWLAARRRALTTGWRALTERAGALARRWLGACRDAGPATVRLVSDRARTTAFGQARVAVATAVRGAAGPPPPPPTARTRHQRQALRSRRLETTVAVTVVVLGLLVGVFAPGGGPDGAAVREARASSSIAEGVSRPEAVDAPAAAPDAGSTADATGTGPGDEVVVAPPLERSVPIRVRIPYLDTDVEVFGADLTPDGGPPSPSEEDAMRAAWYAGGVSPGERGAAILVGHLDTYDGPAAFAGLGSLQPGETIEIDRASGEVAVFTVDSVEQYPKSDFPDERVYGSVSSPQLRLITCGGRWSEDGGYDSNIVAYARLTDSLAHAPEPADEPAPESEPEPADEAAPEYEPEPEYVPEPADEAAPEPYPYPEEEPYQDQDYSSGQDFYLDEDLYADEGWYAEPYPVPEPVWGPS
ncbi:class F sortase [Streptomyces sp. DSM 44915]|uniref:Class F sortase n=1 Tax=Streptomyces chisholmiae TaxID=3075540 RepID=A0ABU2JZC3_9ACTN|nr:class F sortase [Streptomyces sp. DSM 44915]MDT0270111.1 class F sortase [Streptomyces sp. DSM 44915]